MLSYNQSVDYQHVVQAVWMNELCCVVFSSVLYCSIRFSSVPLCLQCVTR